MSPASKSVADMESLVTMKNLNPNIFLSVLSNVLTEISVKIIIPTAIATTIQTKTVFVICNAFLIQSPSISEILVRIILLLGCICGDIEGYRLSLCGVACLGGEVKLDGKSFFLAGSK